MGRFCFLLFVGAFALACSDSHPAPSGLAFGSDASVDAERASCGESCSLPTSDCLDGRTRRTYANAHCENGGCVYESHTERCESICLQGECVNLEARSQIKDDLLRPNTLFGKEFATDGQTLIVSTDREENSFFAVFRKRESGWFREATLRVDAFVKHSHVSLGVDGDQIAIGRPLSAACGTGFQQSSSNTCYGRGIVAVFTRNDDGQWREEARIQPDEHAPSMSEFGSSVALQGSRLIVSARRDSSCAYGVNQAYSKHAFCGIRGAIYVYEREGEEWKQTFYIKPKLPAKKLGVHLSVSGNRILASTETIDTDENCQERKPCSPLYGAFVFEYRDGTWHEEVIDARQQNDFITVYSSKAYEDLRPVIDGNRIVLSGRDARCASGMLPTPDNECVGTNLLAVFEKGESWNLVSTIHAPHRTDGFKDEILGRWGSRLALSGDTLFISEDSRMECLKEYGPRVAGEHRYCHAGVVHLYSHNAGRWRKVRELGPSVNNSQWGASIAFESETLFVGAPIETSCHVGIDAPIDVPDFASKEEWESSQCARSGALYAIPFGER